MSVRDRFAASAGRLSAALALAALPTFALSTAAWSMDHSAHAGHSYAKMTDAEMKQVADKYWATHKQKGVTPASRNPNIVAASTISTDNFFFSPANVTINQGDTVRWNWNAGFHTTTNGVDENDPNAGSLWSASLDVNNKTFAYKFTQAGSFPYFCAFHSSVMRGTITVNPVTDVQPVEGPVAHIGFAASPSPNPTHGGFNFQFALRQSGHVRADLFDAAGRKIVNLVDRDMSPGTFSAAYNGHATPRAGVYWVRLSVPGANQSRRVVIEE
jgi:plastocyanin